MVVIRTPVRPNSNSAEVGSSVVLNYSCCGVRIELAVGSLPYPRQSGVPINCLVEGRDPTTSLSTTDAWNLVKSEFGLTGVLMTTTPPPGPTRTLRGVLN